MHKQLGKPSSVQGLLIYQGSLGLYKAMVLSICVGRSK